MSELSWPELRRALYHATAEGEDDAASLFVLAQGMDIIQMFYGASDPFFLGVLGYVSRRCYEAGAYAWSGLTLEAQGEEPWGSWPQI